MILQQEIMIVDFIFSYIGDWSNGMIGVSKTFGGSSILSSPVFSKSEMLEDKVFPAFCFSFRDKSCIIEKISEKRSLKNDRENHILYKYRLH